MEWVEKCRRDLVATGMSEHPLPSPEGGSNECRTLVPESLTPTQRGPPSGCETYQLEDYQLEEVTLQGPFPWIHQFLAQPVCLDIVYPLHVFGPDGLNMILHPSEQLQGFMKYDRFQSPLFV